MRKKDMKKKDIMKKMKLRRKQLLIKKQISTGCGMGNGCDAKIRKLRKNNWSLARALSDQKMEASHWYAEAITMKGELQQLQEKMLRLPDSNMHVENVFVEVEKQIKECYESINKDFNSALDRIVQAVEKLTKVKHLVGGIQNTLQVSCQGPGNIFTRTPGSRIPLRSSGSSPSPRQRAVPPMVSGHVLQPVMVPLPKLKIDWTGRKNNHFLVVVNEENGLNMSTIGEQSSPENSEVNGVSEEQQSSDVEEEHQLQNDVMATPDGNMLGSQSQNKLHAANLKARLGEDTSRRYRMRSRTDSSPEPQVTRPVGVRVSSRIQTQLRRGREKESGRRQSSSSRISKSSPAKASQHLAEGKEVHTSTPDEEDPLEGPSWLLDVGRARVCRTRLRERAKAHKQKRSKTAGDAATWESSDEDADESVDISPKFRQGGFQESSSRKKVASPATAPKDSPSQSLDDSCLDSPTSMLARLETLEAVGGRKSKRFLKRKKHFVNSESFKAKGEDASLSLQQDKQLDKSAMTKTEKFCTPRKMGAGADSRKMGAGADSTTENDKEVPWNTSCTLISESAEVHREDNNDLTCKVITNMDITLPVSNPIIQENSATSVEKKMDGLQDESKFTQSKNKFFKTRELELFEEIPEKVERTPFDLSMLNESVVQMPPFSSIRATEKENRPPLSPENGNESVSLCDVSVVLEDIMKQPVYSGTPKELLMLRQKDSQSAKCVSSHTPRKLRSVARRTLQYTVNYNEDDEEIRKPKRARKTVKKGKKEDSPKTVDMLVESTPNLRLKSLRKSATKPHDDNLEDTHIELEESEGTKASVRLSDKIFLPEGLSECFVRIHRTPSKNKKKNPQGQIAEVEVASDTSTVTPSNSHNSSPVNTERNTNHVEEEGKYEENTQTRIGSDEPKDDCILLDIEDICDKKQIQQGESTQQGQLVSEKHDVAVSLGFEGFEKVGTPGTPGRCTVPLKPSTGNSDIECLGAAAETSIESSKTIARESRNERSVKCNYKVQKSSESISNTEEHPSEDCSRKRRAAFRVSSFKEVGLNRKMRRGKNDTVIISGPEVKGRGRGRGRGKSSGKSKVVEIEVSP